MGGVLFFCSHGSDLSAVRSWLFEARGLGDVALVSYADADLPAELRPAARFVLQNKDYKFPNFLKFLALHPQVRTDYDGFFFIDDDIVFSPGTIGRFLTIVRAAQLAWAQPALDRASQYSWSHLREKVNGGVIRQDFLEIQVFFMSAAFLLLCLPHLERVRSGYGLDYALMHELTRHALRAGVVHQVAVHHPRRPESETVRAKIPEFQQEGDAIIRWFQSYFDSSVSLEAVQLMARLTGQVRWEQIGFYERTLRRLKKLGAVRLYYGLRALRAFRAPRKRKGASRT